MKQNLKQIIFYSLMIVMSGLMVSCNSTGDEPPAGDVFYDIATLVSSSKEAGTVVTVQEGANTPLVTLTFPNEINKELVPVGTRFLLAYVPLSGVAYQSGPITVYGIGYVYNSVVTEGNKETTNSWATMQQNIISLWRTGNWINIQAECTYVQEKPTMYKLVVDETTLDTEYPEVHLLYEADTSVNADTKLFYSTFNIESVWSLEHVKGIRVTAVGNTGTRTYNFMKDRAEDIQPAN